MRLVIMKIWILLLLIPLFSWGCSSDTPESAPASTNTPATAESTDDEKSDSSPAQPEAKTKLPSPY